jgi:SAM-dependent methyltransferase
MEEKWKDVYSKRFGGMWTPSEGFVKFSARYLQRRVGIDAYDIKRKIGRILDAGCGIGRHIVFFAEQGFDVYGVDISKEAIEIANAWVFKKGLKADLRVGDIEKLPFDDRYFDVVISHGVLDHITFSKAKKAMEEIGRVLAANGYLYITLRSTEDSEFGRGEKVEHNTFVLQEGYEKGIIQHYFDLDEIKELFEGFKVFDIEIYEERFPSVFTVDKAFLQSSKGDKKYIDLSKPLDMNLKYSRWYIAAEKV